MAAHWQSKAGSGTAYDALDAAVTAVTRAPAARSSRRVEYRMRLGPRLQEVLRHERGQQPVLGVQLAADLAEVLEAVGVDLPGVVGAQRARLAE